MSAATYRRPVVIIGAGLTGLITAVSMQRAGLTPLVSEKKPHLPHAKTGVVLWGNGMRVVDRLGVGTKLRTCGLATFSSEILNSTDGRVLFKFNFSEESSGHVNEIIVAELNELKQLLLEELPSESVVFNKELDSFTQHSDFVDVHLADGSNAEGSILIGADGLYSRVRSILKLQMSHRTRSTSARSFLCSSGARSGAKVDVLGRCISELERCTGMRLPMLETVRCSCGRSRRLSSTNLETGIFGVEK